jgi:hypothetical protein
MALAGEYWATDGGAGTKTGLSLANAAGIDPNAADDIWTIINGDTVVSDVRINLCADSAVTIGSTVSIVKDGTTGNRLSVHGRDAADTTDTEVILDAGGGAFPVITLTTADYWVWFDIHATNTNLLNPNDAWAIGGNADNLTFVRCTGSWGYRGFDFISGALYSVLVDCRAHNNTSDGFSIVSFASVIVGCVSHNNAGRGFYSWGSVTRCISYDNGDNGFTVQNLTGCVSFDNAGNGFHVFSTIPSGVCVDCISVSNSAWGYDIAATVHVLYLLRCADYDNTSGRVDTTQGTLLGDDDDPGLSADPFVEAAPKYTLAAGAGGATSTDNGGDSNIEDLNNGSWGGSVEVGDRIRFFEVGTDEEDAIETVVTAVSVGADDDVITVSPQVTAATQKQCWLGGGNFALNAAAGGGAKCRNTGGRATVDGWSTDYQDIGAVQHLASGGGGGGLLVHPGTSGGARG